jgi:hypothetical protein
MLGNLTMCLSYEHLAPLKGYTVAVEARWYLQNLLDSSAKEPLVSALGGLPFALKSHFEADLEKWKTAGITPLFVFEGLSLFGEDDISIRVAKEASTSMQEGWELYAASDPNRAVTAFGSSREFSSMARDTRRAVLTLNRSRSSKRFLSFLSKGSQRPRSTLRNRSLQCCWPR